MQDLDVSLSRSGDRVCAVVAGPYTKKVVCHDLSAQPGKTRVKRQGHYANPVEADEAAGLLEKARACQSRFDRTKLWMREFGSDHSEVEFIIRELGDIK